MSGVGPWRRWSLRTRLMAIGLLGLATAQALGSIALAAALHVSTERRVERSADASADQVEALIRRDRLPETLPVAGTELVQVLDEAGRVVSASQNADRLTAMLRPDEVRRALSGPVEVSGSRLAVDSRLQVRATAVVVGDERRTILVAEPLDELESSDAVLRHVLMISYPLILLVLGLIAYRVIGAAMRPVEDLRSAADRISGSGHDERLPVPPSDDEVHALAVTLNSMLDRLDRAREREAGFVADAAHELRNPLSSMRMQVDVARRLGDGGQLAEDLHEDVERLTVLVDDLLALARLDASRSGTGAAAPAGPVDVRPALERLASDRVSVAPGPDLNVSMAPGELDRILANLVGNGLRHGQHVRLSAGVDGDRVVIRVEDDGPGIPPADRDRVFERFTRLDEARDRDAGGSGLGLPIVRDLARSRGGDVRLGDSELGGLLVEVQFPSPSRSSSA